MHQYCYVSMGGKILGIRIGYNYLIDTDQEGDWDHAMELNRKLGVDEKRCFHHVDLLRDRPLGSRALPRPLFRPSAGGHPR